ncbi:DUF3817 domain-containing protein [Herbiconiux ginsengi]|uniref:Integral membrane protein n=1 Tax=Herbiconiux ginsengi TaxID=381665 RepID=A0A1H3KMI1_9MICO|nr:DUF3817 domain-containing protein [Herbiconiux ginsengi]SDY53246.1 integral membrane protein [Herbiconiux ginsengi]
MTPRRLFRLFAIAEAVTWALLLTGMLLKYAVGVGDWPVTVAGALHGFVFIAYAIVVVVLPVNQRWRAAVVLLAGASAIVPFATIPVEIAFDRRGLLAGAWRRTAGDDPRDRRMRERALRAALARPAVTATLLAVVAAGLFAALLVAGPPGGTDS